MMELVQIISTVGFPVFMCIWFMFRMERVIKSNTLALDKLRNSIDLKIVN